MSSSRIFFQSQEEKELRKWQRKEEKKQARREAAIAKHIPNEEMEDREKYLKALGIDPDQLRTER